MGKTAKKQPIISVDQKSAAPRIELLSSEEISDGVQLLFKTLDGSVSGIPPYNCEAGTIYLRFATTNIKGSNPLGRVMLPNPLSLDRSVCMIAHGLAKDETLAPTLRKLIEDVGVTGNIAIIPVEEIKEAISMKNEGKLYHMSKSYDTFIAEEKVLNDIGVDFLFASMSNQGKSIAQVKCKRRIPTPEKIEMALRKSFAFPNKAKDTYIWRVGHRGMTESELKANVTNAFGAMSKWCSSFPQGLSHFSTVRLANGVGVSVDLYVNSGEVIPETPFVKPKSFPKADQQLYQMNRMQKKDGFAYWKLNDKKMRELFRSLSGGKRIVVVQENRKNHGKGRSNKKLTPGVAATPRSAKKPKVDTPKKEESDAPSEGFIPLAGTPANSGTPASSKKRRRSKNNTPKPCTPGQPQDDTAVTNGTPSEVEAPTTGQTPSGTPASSKKRRRSKNNTPKPSTPGQPQDNTAVTNGTPLVGQTPINGQTPSGTPASSKKRRRSKNNTPKPSTPGQPQDNTPLKAETPVAAQQTPLKENTPAGSKQATPSSVNVESLTNGAATPGSGKKRRLSNQSGTPVVEKNTPVVAKENTPVAAKENTPNSAKPVTPLVVPVTPGNVATPGSGGKRRRTRKSLMPSTPGVATPGSDSKKSPKMKMRLRQRTSVSFAKN